MQDQKLVDVTKLIEQFNNWAYSIAPTGHETARESTNKVKVYDTIQEAIKRLSEAPAIEAIPINWLEEFDDAYNNVLPLCLALKGWRNR